MIDCQSNLTLKLCNIVDIKSRTLLIMTIHFSLLRTTSIDLHMSGVGNSPLWYVGGRNDEDIEEICVDKCKILVYTS